MSQPPALDGATLDLARPDGVEIDVRAGEPLPAPGSDPVFVVVLSGQVAVAPGIGAELPGGRALLGSGCTLGEASILGDAQEPAAVAQTDVKALKFTAEWLRTAVDRLPGLRAHVLATMTHACGTAWEAALILHRRGQAAQRLAKAGLQSGSLVAHSRAMREVAENILTLARTSTPVTLLGERGTGKTFVATKIYEAGCGPDSPFIEVDCRRLDSENGAQTLFGSARPGCHPLPTAQHGAVHLAHGGVLLLRHVECLPPPCQPLLFDCLEATRTGGENWFPRPRLLCTSRQDLDALAEGGRFHRGLATALLRNMLRLPNMERRRRDIPDLVDEFLGERHDGSRLSKEAAAVLYSRDYPTYHVGELKGVVSFAAVMANGGPIRAQHLIGERRLHALDVYPARTSGPVRWLTLGPGLTALRTLTALTFGAVLLATALLSQAPAGRLANGLVWTFWEPLLILSFLLLGRVWCAVCPLALPGLGLQRAFGLGLKVPGFLRERGPLLAALGIALIYLAGHAFELRTHPERTAVLLFTLVGSAAACGLVFERHAWCQHLCPMGSLAGTFANASSLRVWANPWFCANRCHNAPCLNGTDRAPGCPTFHHPNQATTLSQCKFCLKCLRLCPEEAVTIQLDVPVARLWNATTLDARLTPALLWLVALSLLLIAADRLPWIHTVRGLLLTAGAAAALGAALTQALQWGFRQETSIDSSLTARLAGALLVLSWGALTADQIGHLSWLEAVRIGVAQAAAPGPGATLVSGGVGLVLLLQLAVLPASALAGAYALRTARRRLRSLGGDTSSWKWAALYALVGLHLAASLGLTLGAG